ncbi:hypothetical protein [Rufibacter latericius]|uniref:DUF4168 domain-containing protein n=1 Tax=Rufibacter latericius TaxID=2487040 RepID=A0A3M9M8B4_9BACT|nr:hypothetical protein [Rufibacter latericius]RNI21814.1 hypothetical protein EFB08_21960 [Rufibacter latericius]
MKTILFSTCLFLALAFSASAQEAPKNDAVEKTSVSISRRMVQEMGLNEVDFIQVRNLNQERLQKAAQASRTYDNDPSSLETALREIDEEFETKLFRILSNRQLEAYAEFKLKPEGNFLSLVQQVSPKSKKKR